MANVTRRDRNLFDAAVSQDWSLIPTATEVAILDRSGRAVWKKSKGEVPSPIRWNGSDFQGQMVQTGDYICKIVYPDDKIAYLPFVFMKQ